MGRTNGSPGGERDATEAVTRLLASYHGAVRRVLDKVTKGELPGRGMTRQLLGLLAHNQEATARLIGCDVGQLIDGDVLPRFFPLTCYVDLDGVLADFVGGALRAHGFPKDHPLRPGDWDICKSMGMRQPRFWSKLQGEEFWESLEPTCDGANILWAAERLFGVANVYLLTAPSLDPRSRSGKYNWVKANLGEGYADRLILTRHKRLVSCSGAVLVDDSDANCREFANRGGIPVLVPRVWNSLHGLATPDVSDYVACELNALFT